MKTLKYLSTLLKEVYKSRGDTAISYLKNDKGIVTYTNGNYLIQKSFDEAKELPELFIVDVKRPRECMESTIVNGYVISSPKYTTSKDYPDCDLVINSTNKNVPIVSITLNAEYLANIAKVIAKDGNSITLNITDDMTCVKITAKDSDGVGYVMPMNPKFSGGK
jgi:hypothetical protein